MTAGDRDLSHWIPRLVALYRERSGRPSAQWVGKSPTARPNAQLEPKEIHSVAKAVREISLGLTGERSLVGARYLEDPRLLSAYLLFYWVISYAQVRQILMELPSPLGEVLDLGSGPGPGALAALEAGARRATAADRSSRALQLAQSLAREAHLPLTTRPWSLGQPLPEGSFDTILAQHLFNEIPTPRQRLELAHGLLAKLRPGGTLLLLEPALRETSRELLALRDELVAEGYAVRAPCLYRGGCPALHRVSDWCHAERDWETPPTVHAIAQAAGLHKERLKMSYLALAPAGEPWPEPPSGRLFRIVSEPLRGKGRRRYMACGPEGRLGLALQEKHETEANQAFLNLQRGELVRLTGVEARGDGLRLAADSTVERLAAPGQPVPRGEGSG